MLKLYIALQMAALTMLAGIEDRVTKIVIVGIVVAAIKFFVTSESAKIK